MRAPGRVQLENLNFKKPNCHNLSYLGNGTGVPSGDVAENAGILRRIESGRTTDATMATRMQMIHSTTGTREAELQTSRGNRSSHVP